MFLRLFKIKWLLGLTVILCVLSVFKIEYVVYFIRILLKVYFEEEKKVIEK